MWRVNDGSSPHPYGPDSSNSVSSNPASSNPEAESAEPRRRAPLATAALAVALIIPVLNLVFSAVSASVLATRDYQMVPVISLAEGLVVFLLAVAAAIMGTIVLVRRSAGRARSAAAIGIAVISLWNIVVGLINGALLQTFLG